MVKYIFGAETGGSKQRKANSLIKLSSSGYFRWYSFFFYGVLECRKCMKEWSGDFHLHFLFFYLGTFKFGWIYQ